VRPGRHSHVILLFRRFTLQLGPWKRKARTVVDVEGGAATVGGVGRDPGRRRSPGASSRRPEKGRQRTGLRRATSRYRTVGSRSRSASRPRVPGGRGAAVAVGAARGHGSRRNPNPTRRRVSLPTNRRRSARNLVTNRSLMPGARSRSASRLQVPTGRDAAVEGGAGLGPGSRTGPGLVSRRQGAPTSRRPPNRNSRRRTTAARPRS
jgi:hypothetical protein